MVLQADSFLWKFLRKQAKWDPRHLNHQTFKQKLYMCLSSWLPETKTLNASDRLAHVVGSTPFCTHLAGCNRQRFYFRAYSFISAQLEDTFLKAEQQFRNKHIFSFISGLRTLKISKILPLPVNKNGLQAAMIVCHSYQTFWLVGYFLERLFAINQVTSSAYNNGNDIRPAEEKISVGSLNI